MDSKKDDSLVADLERKNAQLEAQISELMQIIKDKTLLADQKLPPPATGAGTNKDDPEMAKLEALLQEAHQAKTEAMQFSRVGKNQLVHEVKQLYELLQEAKADRLNQEDRIRRLEEQLARERAAKEEVIEKAAHDRAAYRDMLKEERRLIARSYVKDEKA